LNIHQISNGSLNVHVLAETEAFIDQAEFGQPGQVCQNSSSTVTLTIEDPVLIVSHKITHNFDFGPCQKA
jgi:hypothetical protein